MNSSCFGVVIALVISLLSGVAYAFEGNRFLANNYNAPILFSFDKKEEIKLGNGARARFSKFRNNLFIRTDRYMSPYYDISHILAAIKADEKNHPGQEPVITVSYDPGYVTNAWKTSVSWE